jgi:hypothetical protein
MQMQSAHNVVSLSLARAHRNQTPHKIPIGVYWLTAFVLSLAMWVGIARGIVWLFTAA